MHSFDDLADHRRVLQKLLTFKKSVIGAISMRRYDMPMHAQQCRRVSVLIISGSRQSKNKCRFYEERGIPRRREAKARFIDLLSRKQSRRYDDAARFTTTIRVS